MAKNKIKPISLLTVPEGPTVLLDSSFVLALLNLGDPNYKAAKSIFGFVEPHNCRFHVPVYVFAEVASKIIQQRKKVSETLRMIENFKNELHGILFTGTNPTLDEIINRYKIFAKKRIRFTQSNDFYIVTEGIISKAIILTCDDGMYKKVKPYYKDIYYVATHSKKYKGDIPKFAKRFLKVVQEKNKQVNSIRVHSKKRRNLTHARKGRPS